MSRTDETIDRIESLRDTPRPQRRRRLARLARPTLEAFALVLLERHPQVAAGGRDGPAGGRP